MDNKVAVLLSKRVATEPFPAGPQGPQIVGGFAVAASKNALVPLKVAFDSWTTSDKVIEGTTVYVTSDAADQPFAKVVYELDGKKFILLPEERVVLYHPG